MPPLSCHNSFDNAPLSQCREDWPRSVELLASKTKYELRHCIGYTAQRSVLKVLCRDSSRALRSLTYICLWGRVSMQNSELSIKPLSSRGEL